MSVGGNVGSSTGPTTLRIGSDCSLMISPRRYNFIDCFSSFDLLASGNNPSRRHLPKMTGSFTNQFNYIMKVLLLMSKHLFADNDLIL